MSQLAPRRTSGPPRAGRSAVWTAVMAAVAAMALVIATVFVISLTRAATSASPLVTVADAAGPADLQVVTIVRSQVDDARSTATLRLRNDSTTPVTVQVSMPDPVEGSGSLTAALTAQGAVVRSGALSGLTLGPFTLDASTTTPLAVELDATGADLDALFDDVDHLSVAVAVVEEG